MVKIRTAKQKGSSFEYDCQESLKQKYPDVYLTKQRGFQLQYDIQTDIGFQIFECKRLRGISWNQLVNFWNKLNRIKLEGASYLCRILFKSNNQPCLVFDGHSISEFKDFFEVPFIKHTPIRQNERRIL